MRKFGLANKSGVYGALTLGSIKALSDVDGAATDAYRYSAFGAVEYRAGATTNGYGYTGEYYDEQMGLQYNRARWYDMDAGRFVSRDTWGGKSRTPVTQNKFLYAAADPVNHIDPSGHSGISDQMAGMIGLAILATAAVIMTAWKPNPESSSFDPADSHRKFSIFDAIVISKVTGSSGTETETETVSEEIEKEKRRRDPDHHTIPVYLCGGIVQEMYARIPYPAHVAIHGEIAAIELSLKAGETYAYKSLGYQRMGEVLKLAQNEQGRGAIRNALQMVYNGGWIDIGDPSIGAAFAASEENYVSGVTTSLPWCTRNKGP